MAILTSYVLPPAIVDVPLAPVDPLAPPGTAQNFTIATTTVLPLPIITVVSVVPSLIQTSISDQGAGAGVVVAPLQAGVAVPITFSGAWPQENFPNYSFRYVILPSTEIISVPTIEQVPANATLVGYTADLLPSKTNTWTITVSDGSVLACTQVVNNNWSRQQTKLAARMNANAA